MTPAVLLAMGVCTLLLHHLGHLNVCLSGYKSQVPGVKPWRI